MNPKEMADWRIEKAGKSLGLSEEEIQTIQVPEHIIRTSFYSEMDDGRRERFFGFRVQHNNALGPYKGGIRFHPGVTLEEVEALATWMSLKCSLVDIPMGGGKGGIICDPKSMSKAELERMTREFTRQLAPFIGPDTDIPAPDVNTNSETMRWIYEEYSKIQGKPCPAVVTGKPLDIGGSEGRVDATGYGAFLCAKWYCGDLKGKRVVIHGLGNVGSVAAKYFIKEGAKVVAICNSKGGYYDPAGISLANIMGASERRELPFYNIPDYNLLVLPCDVLILAALENTLTSENAGNVRASVIVEGANGPITPEADEKLNDMGVTVIPDILANAGGVIVSYFEWVQNRLEEHWSEDQVLTQLENVLRNVFDMVESAWLLGKLHASWREVAYEIAVERINNAMKRR